MKATKLALYTVDFPFGNYEISFLPQEIRVLSAYFSEIHLFPFYKVKSANIQLPTNVIVHEPAYGLSKGNSFGDNLRAFTLTLKEIAGFACLKHVRNFRYHYAQMRKFVTRAKDISETLRTHHLTGAEVVHYCYWTDEWANIMSLLKRSSDPGMKLVSRAHGFDLYNERNTFGYIFPRNLQFSMIDSVYAVSEGGRDYLIKNFPAFATKFKCSRLGTVEPEKMPPASVAGSALRLVSCSAVIELKRVNRIVNILSKMTVPVEWIHFGDGPLMPEIRQSASSLPGNVKVYLKGNVENSQILLYYSEHPIDWFINVSEYEGLPFSMMEAISFGIPLIGTDVGAVKEIVTLRTGVLLDKHFDEKQAAEILQNRSFSENDRQDIRNFWRENYSAVSNYSRFGGELTTWEH